MEVAKDLESQGKKTRIISVPCMDLFHAQDAEYKMSILCQKGLKVAIEAGVRQGWEYFIGPHGMFFGMDSFGESAPASDLYKHFGIEKDYIVKEILSVLDN